MSAAIYWLAIRLYALVLRAAALFNPKAKKFIKGRRKLLQHIRYSLIDERRPRIWMHCASLGEFEQGRPLLEALRQKHPGYAFILTFFSPSGYEVRKDYEGADYVFYLPLDSNYNARHFLDSVQPRLAIFVKYELWYFFLSRLARRDIPLVLISAAFRKDQPFFKWYGRLHRRMLHCFTHIFVQNKMSADLLNRIGVEHVSVNGDTRFDRVLQAARHSEKLSLADEFCKGARVLVAGSTWRKDEVFLREVINHLSQNWKLILVPHEVDETHLNEIENLYDGIVGRWSAGNVDKRVLMIDKVGLLMKIYSYGDAAWIGGAFDKEGVHNVLEAAVYGMPVAFGPVYDKFIEAGELLQEHGAITTSNPLQFARHIMQWETDTFTYEQVSSAAKKYVQSKGGATSKILRYLEEKNWLNVV
jgi:3-deoxy-D-manno-octulosonic-acid transferase